MSNVTMDIMSELASAIVEREWNSKNYPKPHTVEAKNGDLIYIDEVQDEFNSVLDICDRILNSEHYTSNGSHMCIVCDTVPKGENMYIYDDADFCKAHLL